MSRRNAAVLAGLLASLVLTSMLLLALAPAPLTPDAALSLFATQDSESLDRIFQTKTAINPNRWRYIYIHHTTDHYGSALSLAEKHGDMPDHFLIGNGNGCLDGEIQIGHRWNLQQPARSLDPKVEIGNNCLSICLVGDFDNRMPTQTQVQRLQQLLRVLQKQYQIPVASVITVDRPASPAGIGRQFPRQALRPSQLP